MTVVEKFRADIAKVREHKPGGPVILSIKPDELELLLDELENLRAWAKQLRKKPAR